MGWTACTIHFLRTSRHSHSTLFVWFSLKLKLYSVYVLPVFWYGAEPWTMTKAMSAKVDAFDQWCLHHIFRIRYSQHVSNTETRSRTGCPPLFETIRSRRLRLDGHIARAGLEMNHCCALHAAIKQRAVMHGTDFADSYAPVKGPLLMMRE